MEKKFFSEEDMVFRAIFYSLENFSIEIVDPVILFNFAAGLILMIYWWSRNDLRCFTHIFGS